MITLLLNLVIGVISVGLVLWIAGAIYFDVGGASVTGAVVSMLWLVVAAGILCLWQPLWKPFLLLAIGGACFVTWWLSQRPSHDRQWNPHFALLPRVEICSDKVTIEHVRNADFDGTGAESPKFETRSYRLSELCAVDALIAYWGSKWMCHPMFLFDFGPDGRVCFSIEVRYRTGQKYSFLRSLYRQQELMYVVCDERDAILRRTKTTPCQDLYLYRLKGNAIGMRSFFLEYVNSINSLVDEPRWYNGLTTNCTTSIYTQGRGRMKWDWRMLFNGRLDELLYDLELLDRCLPFADLKAQSRINELANSARIDDFGETIRRNLPGLRKSPAGDQGQLEALRSLIT